jgi:hypothetical protein
MVGAPCDTGTVTTHEKGAHVVHTPHSTARQSNASPYHHAASVKHVNISHVEGATGILG